MGNCKDLWVWQGPHCDGYMTGAENPQNSNFCGMFLVRSGQNLPNVDNGKNSKKSGIRSWASKSHMLKNKKKGIKKTSYISYMQLQHSCLNVAISGYLCLEDTLISNFSLINVVTVVGVCPVTGELLSVSVVLSLVARLACWWWSACLVLLVARW